MIIYPYIQYGWAQKGTSNANDGRTKMANALKTKFLTLPPHMKGQAGLWDSDLAQACIAMMSKELGTNQIKYPKFAAGAVSKEKQNVLAGTAVGFGIFENPATKLIAIEPNNVFSEQMIVKGKINNYHRAYLYGLIATMIMVGSRQFFALAAAKGSASINEIDALRRFTVTQTKMPIKGDSEHVTVNRIKFYDMTTRVQRSFLSMCDTYPNMDVTNLDGVVHSVNRAIALLRLTSVT